LRGESSGKSVATRGNSSVLVSPLF
jgi:hypothetical protein